MELDLPTGAMLNEAPRSRRFLGELASIFRDEAAALGDPKALVYETYGCPGEVEGPARLLYATTVLQPGQVGGEFFMTRGHFHTNPVRGEIALTLRGVGALILMNREGETWQETMGAGSVHDIDGALAHRVANTGSEPVVFFVSWMSDCGHDYQSIASTGFSKSLISSPQGPLLVPR